MCNVWVIACTMCEVLHVQCVRYCIGRKNQINLHFYQWQLVTGLYLPNYLSQLNDTELRKHKLFKKICDIHAKI